MSCVAHLLDAPSIARLEPEGGVLHVEVVRQAAAQLVEHVGGDSVRLEHDV